MIKKHLQRNFPMRLSALFTCILVCYVSVSNVENNIEIWLKIMGFVIFFLAFITVTSKPANEFSNTFRVLFFIQITVSLVLSYFDTNDVVAVIFLIISTQLPARFSNLTSLLIIAFMSLSHYLMQLSANNQDALFNFQIYSSLQLFGYFAVDKFLKEEVLKNRLSRINEELIATRFFLKQSSEREERLRISRDLHDVVGHKLTALSMNLEVSYHKSTDFLKPALKNHIEQSKEILSDIRIFVQEERKKNNFNFETAINEIFEKLPNCDLEMKSIQLIQNHELKEQLLLCLQEGISNGIRHGKAKRFVLTMIRRKEKLILLLENKVDNRQKVIKGSGLNGMTERLGKFQGEVEAINEDGIFRLEISVIDTARLI